MRLYLGSVAMMLGLLPSAVTAFGARVLRASVHGLALDMASVGIFYGTSTGSTQEVADLIKEEFGDDAEGPFDVEALEGSVKENFEKYDALVVGTPTWNTGADVERSGTGWDEIYYTSLPEINVRGKKVAVFGLGDQVSYAENYADATGELHDVFESLGCVMMGYTSQEGYEHEDSKSIRGDKFCGLLCDAVNQEELTDERVRMWVSQLKEEGLLETGPSSLDSPIEVSPAAPVKVAAIVEDLDAHSSTPDKTGYTPYYNPTSKTTMWVSSDGRSCYYSVGNTPRDS
jgi:flavodoxin I